MKRSTSRDDQSHISEAESFAFTAEQKYSKKFLEVDITAKVFDVDYAV